MRDLRISRYRDGFLVMLEGGKRSTSSQRGTGQSLDGSLLYAASTVLPMRKWKAAEGSFDLFAPWG